jgi:hypothetical protein
LEDGSSDEEEEVKTAQKKEARIEEETQVCIFPKAEQTLVECH